MHSPAAPAPVTVLELPTGRLIVGDPATLFGDAEPVACALPPGGFPVAVTEAGAEVRLGAADGGPAPDPGTLNWTRVADVPTSSGYLALLDAAALEAFSELGDEPVDEFELLCERLGDEPGRPLAYEGLVVLPVRGDAVRARTGTAELLVGADAEGRPALLALRF